MRKQPASIIILSTIIAAVFCAAARAQTISTFAGGGLPANITGPSVSLGGLGGETGYSLGNFSGALGRTATDSFGNVYFIAFNSVLEWNVTTGVVTVVAGNGTVGFSGDNGAAVNAQLNNPFGVAIDTLGNLYISDAGNVRIRRVTSGTITTFAGNGSAGSGGDGGLATQAQFLQLTGLAVDSSGSVYAADQGTNKVRKITSGMIASIAGGGTTLGDGGLALAAMLNQPLGIAVDSLGSLYIADRLNNRIRKVTSGIITTIAGNGTAGSSGDNGPATGAELSAPTDVVVDSTGFYVADAGNYRIRKVTGSTIATIAGTGIQGFTASGLGMNAQFRQPSSIAVDGSSDVYISDPGNNRISKLAGGNISIVIGGGSAIGDGAAATAGQLGYPSGLAIDSAGNVYIADPINQRVRKIASGKITTVAGGGSATGDGGQAISAQLLQPQAIAIDSSDNLYIADTAANKIRKVSGGVITTVAGSGAFGFSGDNGPATAAALGWPTGVAVDSSGNIFVADYYSGRVREVTANGNIATVAGGGSSSSDSGAATSALISPTGVAVDASGNLFIADQLNHKIRRVSGGAISTVAGNGTVGSSGDGGPATSAGMGPVNIALDAAGNLYLADLFNNRVRRVAGGAITTIAGTGSVGFSGEFGFAVNAQMDAPEAAVVDATGNLYIADTGNNRVRMVTGLSSCSYLTNLTMVSATSAGGNYPITLTTGSSCTWSVTGLPGWIAVSGASSGTGSATITLVVSPNTGGAQTATLSIGSASVQVTQAAAPACLYTLLPGSLQPTSTGGTFAVAIQTTAGCAWSVGNLPTWITISGPPSGAGSGTVMLVVAPGAGSPRSAIVTIGSTLAVNQQNAAGAICTYALSVGGQAFAATAGNGSFTVTAVTGCTWTATPSVSWITTTSAGSGNGGVSFQVAANAGAARVGTIAVLGVVFTVEQGASSISGFTGAGSLPDLTVAGGWATSITLVNPSAAATQMRLSFFDSNGNALTLPLTFPQTASSASGPLLASSIDRTLAAGAMLEIGSTGPLSQSTTTGWAQLLANGAANGFAKFRFTAGSLDHQALIPLENRGGTQFVVAYDNTGGFADGIAVANTTSQPVSVAIIIRNDTGVVLNSSSIGLQPMGSNSFVLPSIFPVTNNGRGTVELDAAAAGEISMLGIEYNTNTGGFSTIPALIKQ